jgi:hypothetical protein
MFEFFKELLHHLVEPGFRHRGTGNHDRQRLGRLLVGRAVVAHGHPFIPKSHTEQTVGAHGLKASGISIVLTDTEQRILLLVLLLLFLLRQQFTTTEKILFDDTLMYCKRCR